MPLDLKAIVLGVLSEQGAELETIDPDNPGDLAQRMFNAMNVALDLGVTTQEIEDAVMRGAEGVVR